MGGYKRINYEQVAVVLLKIFDQLKSKALSKFVVEPLIPITLICHLRYSFHANSDGF